MWVKVSYIELLECEMVEHWQEKRLQFSMVYPKGKEF